MQYKPASWITGFKRSPRAANVQHRDMGLFLNSSGKFETIDDSWDNLHSGGMFISDDNKIYFRDETNKDIYINSPVDNQITIGATSGVGINCTPGTMLELNGTEPYLTLRNTTEEDTEGGRESKIIFEGEQSGSEDSTLAVIQASHDGTSDDEKGDLIFSTNDGSDGASPTEAMRIDSAGNVGIGVTPRDDWVANYTAMQIGPQGSLANYSDGRTIVGDNWYDDGAYKYIATDFASRYSQHNGEHLFDVAVSGSADGTITWLRAMDIEQGRDVKIEAGNLVIGTAGKGIDFQNQASPAAGMTSELLDRYEEGTWTAELKGLTSAATTPVTVTGCYTRIGRQVNLTAFFSNVDTSGASGSMAVSGYPFTPPSTDAFRAAGSTVTYGLSVPNKGLTPTNQGAVDRCQFYSPTDDGGWNAVNITAGSGKYLFLTITYVV